MSNRTKRMTYIPLVALNCFIIFINKFNKLESYQFLIESFVAIYDLYFAIRLQKSFLKWINKIARNKEKNFLKKISGDNKPLADILILSIMFMGLILFIILFGHLFI